MQQHFEGRPVQVAQITCLPIAKELIKLTFGTFGQVYASSTDWRVQSSWMLLLICATVSAKGCFPARTQSIN